MGKKMDRISGEILYYEALKLSRSNSQTVGDKNDNYITLEQLMALIDMVDRTQPALK